MRSNRFGYGRCFGLCTGVATACLMVMTAAHAQAAGGSFTRGCAARDMQILMLIEQSESASEVSTQKNADALLAMLHARMVCFEGNVRGALSLYDDIARRIADDTALVGQGRMH